MADVIGHRCEYYKQRCAVIAVMHHSVLLCSYSFIPVCCADTVRIGAKNKRRYSLEEYLRWGARWVTNTRHSDPQYDALTTCITATICIGYAFILESECKDTAFILFEQINAALFYLKILFCRCCRCFRSLFLCCVSCRSLLLACSESLCISRVGCLCFGC